MLSRAIARDACARRPRPRVAARSPRAAAARSVGYGDICPQNPDEMRWCTLLLLWGSCLWAYIIGNACGIVSTLDVDTIAHRQRMDQARSRRSRAATRWPARGRRARLARAP